MKRHLPFALTTLRLLLGPIALACALAGVTRFVYLPILIAATLSDIFDGILARKFGVVHRLPCAATTASPTSFITCSSSPPRGSCANRSSPEISG
jgi:hypothetical protein